jgi:hypothetical protein
MVPTADPQETPAHHRATGYFPPGHKRGCAQPPAPAFAHFKRCIFTLAALSVLHIAAPHVFPTNAPASAGAAGASEGCNHGLMPAAAPLLQTRAKALRFAPEHLTMLTKGFRTTQGSGTMGSQGLLVKEVKNGARAAGTHNERIVLDRPMKSVADPIKE